MPFSSAEQELTSYSCTEGDCHHFKDKNQPKLEGGKHFIGFFIALSLHTFLDTGI